MNTCDNCKELLGKYSKSFQFGCQSCWTLQQGKISQLEKELDQQRFNNKNNLSIDQKISDKIVKLEQRLKDAEEVIKDFKNYGTRHDINPTGQFKPCGCFDSMSGDSWQGYIRSQDKHVRSIASDYFKKYKEL